MYRCNDHRYPRARGLKTGFKGYILEDHVSGRHERQQRTTGRFVGEKENWLSKIYSLENQHEMIIMCYVITYSANSSTCRGGAPS